MTQLSRKMRDRNWGLWAILFWLVAALGCAQEGLYDWNNARELSPGIRHAHVKADTPRPLNINCLQIDIQTPGIFFYTTPRAPEWQENVSETIRQTTRQFMLEARRQGKPMIVAINADYWTNWIPATWNQQLPANLGGLAVSEGELVSPAAGTPSFIVYKDGRVEIAVTNKDTDISSIHTAVSGFAIVLKEGEIVGTQEALHPRTAIGISADGRYVYLLTIDGRQAASGGASYPELAAWLKYFGAYTGLNLDGGGSTTMAYWDPQKEGEDKSSLLNVPVGGGRVYSERAVANNLGVCYAPPQEPAAQQAPQ